MALAFLFAEPRGDEARAVLLSMTEVGEAPGHWRLEIANAVSMQFHRGAIAEADARSLLGAAALIRVRSDDETWSRAWEEVAVLSRRHRLTAYDAAYLELALRRRLPLATFDRRLAHAAAAEGVSLTFPEVIQ